MIRLVLKVIIVISVLKKIAEKNKEKKKIKNKTIQVKYGFEKKKSFLFNFEKQTTNPAIKKENKIGFKS